MAITKEQLLAWKDLIPSLASLPAAPKRCILHWTGGPGKANSIDLSHYHYVFNQPDGAVVRGIHGVRRNMGSIAKGSPYAQHTGGFNSGSAGFSFAGMLNSSKGRKFGPAPLKEDQIRRGLAFVAYCMWAWDMRITEETLFTHYEAWTLHKVKGQMNDQKWDITELEFAPHLAKDQVGPWLRDVARDYYAQIERLLGPKGA